MLREVFAFVIKCNPTHLVRNKNEWSWQERRNITQANFLSTSWLITVSSLSRQLVFCTGSSFVCCLNLKFTLILLGIPFLNKSFAVFTHQLLWNCPLFHWACHMKFISIVCGDIMRAAPCDTLLLHSYPRPNWHWLLCSESECPSLCGGGQRRVCTVYCGHYTALTLWWFQLINVDIQQTVMSGVSGAVWWRNKDKENKWQYYLCVYNQKLD